MSFSPRKVTTRLNKTQAPTAAQTNYKKRKVPQRRQQSGRALTDFVDYSKMTWTSEEMAREAVEKTSTDEDYRHMEYLAGPPAAKTAASPRPAQSPAIKAAYPPVE
jgi:hypothetical protein